MAIITNFSKKIGDQLELHASQGHAETDDLRYEVRTSQVVPWKEIHIAQMTDEWFPSLVGLQLGDEYYVPYGPEEQYGLFPSVWEQMPINEEYLTVNLKPIRGLPLHEVIMTDEAYYVMHNNFIYRCMTYVGRRYSSYEWEFVPISQAA